MSYSCTSRGKSQDPSSAKKAAGGGNNPSTDTETETDGRNRARSSSPEEKAAMKVKKGCNSSDAGVPVTTEEELLNSTGITPEDVLGLQKITESKFTYSVFVLWMCGGKKRETEALQLSRMSHT